MLENMPYIPKNRLIRILTDLGVSEKEAIEIHRKTKRLRKDLKRFGEKQINIYPKDKVIVKDGFAYHKMDFNA